jgi:hypothetical protein
MEVRARKEYRVMRTEQNPELAKAVGRIVKLNAQSKDIGFEINEIADAAFEAGHIRGVPNAAAARKVLKRLAKDSIATDVEREEQRLIEEAIDECRAALGLLADTPLGQAAQQRPEPADHQGERRGRGRPKGSRNKPKLATSNGQAMPPPPPLPPDVPDADAA